MLRKKKDKERSEKKEKTEDEKAGGGKPNDDKKGFLVKSANAKAVRRILRDYVGTDEQKRRILEAELGNMPKDGKQRIVKVNRATAQADAFVTVRFNDTEIRATPVLLDSGAWICLFGKTFLRKLIQLGVLKKESELTESPVRYRVHGIHNHAVDTQRFIEGAVFISTEKDLAFADVEKGITVDDVEFYYLPEAKEVIVGRPALEPAKLLPEQQLEQNKGTVVSAKQRRSVKFADKHEPTPEGDEDDGDTESTHSLGDEEGWTPTPDDVYGFFKPNS